MYTTQYLSEQKIEDLTYGSSLSNGLRLVAADIHDQHDVFNLFEALHSYNASLDPHFALSDNWEAVLCEEFKRTYNCPDKLWLLVKDGEKAVGLLIASVHIDSPLFRHRQWVEVEALYVAATHRRQGIACDLLDVVYRWAAQKQLPRVQLYVTATNVRAQNVYHGEGFTNTQAIMRKSLGI
jgi:ribosomal protein S18 acetylase RimI-like enzyme